jgi:two-component system OmpR family sensor kinase
MNELEKKSFYSFLGLYIVSSFLFLALTAFWYYTAQKNAIENETFYRLEHLADHISGEIIVSHMQGTTLRQIKKPDDISIALIDTLGKLKYGKIIDPEMPLQTKYYKKGTYNILISNAPRDHLNIRYVVVQTDIEEKQIAALKKFVVTVSLIAAIVIALIAWILSKLFIKPIHQQVKQIERFINDITHELNTPISSLSMTASEALKQGKCSPRMMKNISISTRQLYDIYRSLSYLNFSESSEDVEEVIDIADVLEQSIRYYSPLAEMKQITFVTKLQSMSYRMPPSQATLLFGNLIGNAIKYSPRGSTIEIRFIDGILSIKDEGIGISPEVQKKIFERFSRGTEYAGGFGVGLSIVKSISQKYGITITLHSKLGEGTEFILDFNTSEKV